jgi:phospholipase/carboxylesterase
MFEVEIGRQAHAALSNAGADVVYREVADLSHTYAREVNPGILDWLGA